MERGSYSSGCDRTRTSCLSSWPDGDQEMAMCVRAVACSRTARRLVNRSARSQRPADLQQMMPRVPDGVVLEHELAGARSVGVERERRGAIELLVAERTDRR